jgi:hypothetical protein
MPKTDLLGDSDQRELINELLVDNSDLAVEYFDEATSSLASTPDTPAAASIKASYLATRVEAIQLLPRSERRLPSTGSTRYQSDPVVNNGRVGPDESNYLVPNPRNATLYTPIVVRENGQSEVVRMNSMEYYNQPHERKKAVENGEYLAEEVETSM